jgi:collagenase-like PrtC family protease
MALSDVAKIFEKLSKLQIEGKLKKIFKIDEVEYGFLPDLDEITLGEYADIEHYVKEGLEKNMHKIMAVLFRPVTSREDKVYSIEAYKDGRERAEKFRKKMNATQVQAALVFFWTFAKEFVKILPLFLMKKLNKIQTEINLQKNGVGSA